MKLKTKSQIDSLGVWMEIKLVLTPSEYRTLKAQAFQQSQNVAEFVTQIIGRHLKSGASRA